MDIHGEPIEYPAEVAACDPAAQQGRFRIVALADSTTLCRRKKSQRWPDLLAVECGPDCAGIGGTSSNLGLFRWHRAVAPIAPDCVIVNFLSQRQPYPPLHRTIASRHLIHCLPR